VLKIHKQVLLKTLTGRTIVFDMAHSSTLRDLKQRVQDAEGVPSDEQELVQDCKVLSNCWTPSDFTRQKSVVHLILKRALAGGVHYCTGAKCGKVLAMFVNWNEPFDEEVCNVCVAKLKATKPQPPQSQKQKKRKKSEESSASEASDDWDFQEPSSRNKERKPPKTAPTATASEKRKKSWSSSSETSDDGDFEVSRSKNKSQLPQSQKSSSTSSSAAPRFPDSSSSSTAQQTKRKQYKSHSSEDNDDDVFMPSNTAKHKQSNNARTASVQMPAPVHNTI
jgi:hypothetical protein